MYRSILVPLDGSPSAEHALPIAVAISKGSGASLTLLRVQPERRAAYSLFGKDMLAELRRMYEQHRVGASDYLTGVANRVAKESGREVQTAVVDGPVANAIRRYSTASGVDLIVMTTHGRTGLSRAWLGSVADAVVRQSRIPTLLLRPTEAEPTSGNGGLDGPLFERVLVRLDGSDEAEAILPHVSALAASSGTRYMLVRVVSPIVAPLSAIPYRLSGPVFEETAIEQRAERAEAQLRAVADRMRECLSGAAVATKVLVDHLPARAILADAERDRVDLIAMTTHGRGAMRYLLGSVADKVLRGATGAVLLYRAPPGLTGVTTNNSLEDHDERPHCRRG